jgi:hypothetical protein
MVMGPETMIYCDGEGQQLQFNRLTATDPSLIEQ